MWMSSGLWSFQPGSVQSGSRWQLLQFAFPLKSSSPRSAASGSKSMPGRGFGDASASW